MNIAGDKLVAAMTPISDEELEKIRYAHREIRKLDALPRTWCNACSGVEWPCLVIRLVNMVVIDGPDDDPACAVCGVDETFTAHHDENLYNHHPFEAA